MPVELYHKNRQAGLWITCALLALSHSMMVGFTEVSSHYLCINALSDSGEILLFSACEALVTSINIIKMHLTLGLKQHSLRNFTSPPQLCTLTCGDEKKKRDGRNKKAHTDEVETSWL